MASQGIPGHPMASHGRHTVAPKDDPASAPLPACLQAGHQSLFQHLIRLIQNHRLYIRERNPGRDTAFSRRRSFDPRRSQQSPIFSLDYSRFLTCNGEISLFDIDFPDHLLPYFCFPQPSAKIKPCQCEESKEETLGIPWRSASDLAAKPQPIGGSKR